MRFMIVRLNDKSISDLVCPAGLTERTFWDGELPGFGLRVRAGGARSWLCQYAVHGETRKVTLGSPTLVTVGAARAAARKIMAAVRLGRDPAAEKRAAPVVELETYIARKALTFLKSGAEPACYLYRHFHPNGDLLYVGISLEPLTRQDRHTKAASWRKLICRILIEPFATREEALAAEQTAIRNEFPKFNVVLNGKRHPVQELTARSP
jgi:hypothetical protein